jgi:hypothetical protein
LGSGAADRQVAFVLCLPHPLASRGHRPASDRRLDARAALEAAGAGDSLPDGLDAALSLGKAMHRVRARSA